MALDTMGNAIWAKDWGLFDDYGFAVKLDTKNNIYITGQYTIRPRFFLILSN